MIIISDLWLVWIQDRYGDVCNIGTSDGIIQGKKTGQGKIESSIFVWIKKRHWCYLDTCHDRSGSRLPSFQG